MNIFSLTIIISLASSCASFYKTNDQQQNNVSTASGGRKVSSIESIPNEFQQEAEFYYSNRGVPADVAIHKHYKSLSFHPNLNLENIPTIIKNAFKRIQNKEQLEMFKSIIKFADDFKAPYLFKYIHKLVDIGLVEKEEAESYLNINRSAKNMIAELTETIDGHPKHDLTDIQVNEITEVSEWLETEGQLVSFKNLMKQTLDGKVLKISYKIHNLHQAEILNYFNSESLKNLERYVDYIQLVNNEYQKNAFLAFVKTHKNNQETESLFKNVSRREFECMTDDFWEVFKKIKTKNQMELFISSINDRKEVKLYFSKSVLENLKNANLIGDVEFEASIKLNNLAKNFLTSEVVSPKERLSTGVPIKSIDVYRYRLSYDELLKLAEQIDTQEKFDQYVNSVQKFKIHAVNDHEMLNSFGIVKELPVKAVITPKESKLDNCLSALSTLLEHMFRGPNY